MHFDIGTLLVAVTLATAFCAGARFLLWRMHRNIPGLGRWALAGVSAVMTFAMILAYGKSQLHPFLSLGQGFAVIGLVLSWDGFRRFLGKSSVNWQAEGAQLSITLFKRAYSFPNAELC